MKLKSMGNLNTFSFLFIYCIFDSKFFYGRFLQVLYEWIHTYFYYLKFNKYCFEFRVSIMTSVKAHYLLKNKPNDQRFVYVFMIYNIIQMSMYQFPDFIDNFLIDKDTHLSCNYRCEHKLIFINIYLLKS